MNVETELPVKGNGTSSNRVRMDSATSTNAGYLTANDWNRFNNNASSTIYTTLPVRGNGTTGDRIRMDSASATTSGYLSSGDWNNFNNKLSALHISTVFTGSGINTINPLDIQYATPSQKGIVSTSSQTIGGEKIFTEGISIQSRDSLKLYDTDNSHSIALRSVAALSANYTLTLPDGYGTNGQFLTTDGSGNLSWTTSTAGTGYITYGTDSTQSTALISEYIFDVSNETVASGGALGAKITAKGGTSTGSATGLTVQATVNGGSSDAVSIKAVATNSGTGKEVALDAEGIITTDNSYAINDTTMLHNKNQSVYVGNEAGGSITGSNNVVVGYQSMKSGSASNNVIVGNKTTPTNMNGKSNVLIGNNISIGSNAADSNNVAIGTGAKINNSNAKYSTAIGALAQVNANHTVVLGAIDGVNGADSSANVGIGTQTPDARLQVVSTDTTTHALKIGGTGSTEYGTLRFASFKEMTTAQLPGGYSYYVFTSNPGTNIKFPTGENGQIMYILNKASGTLTMNTYNASNLGQGQIKEYFYYDGSWYIVQ